MKYYIQLQSVFLFILLLCGTLPAQESPFELGGYVKNLASYQQGTFAGVPSNSGRFQNTVQLRLNFAWYAAENITAVMQSRHLLVYQKNIKQGSAFLDLFSGSPYYFDLQKTFVDENDVQLRSEIDRVYLDWNWQSLQVTVGRQRIAWGSCLVWNPTDLFNPFNILEFDYEEKPGTDALHVQYYLGAVSQIDLAVSPGRREQDVIYAARYFFNTGDYDFSMIAGWQKQSLRLGAGWAGQIWDGGFRGEFLYSRPHIAYDPAQFLPQPAPVPLPEKKITKSYVTIALSYDYSFRNSLYWHMEYLYNGLGTTGDAAARRLETLITGELTPARHSVFQELAYNFTPLWRGDVFVIYNPDDHSWIAAPSLQYSLSENVELYVLAFPSKGVKDSEFGTLPSWYFVRMKYSF